MRAGPSTEVGCALRSVAGFAQAPATRASTTTTRLTARGAAGPVARRISSCEADEIRVRIGATLYVVSRLTGTPPSDPMRGPCQPQLACSAVANRQASGHGREGPCVRLRRADPRHRDPRVPHRIGRRSGARFELPLDDWLATVGRGDNRHWLDWLEEEVGAPDRAMTAVHADDSASATRHDRREGGAARRRRVLDQARTAWASRRRSLQLAAVLGGRPPRAARADRAGSSRCSAATTWRGPSRGPTCSWPPSSVSVSHPGRAIAFEDSHNGSTRRPPAAGLRCVAVPNRVTRGPGLRHCDLVVDSLAELTLPRCRGGSLIDLAS